MIVDVPIHCLSCGTLLVQKIPAGEDRLRGVCPECGKIHYCNPKMVVGTLIEQDDQILLCRRAIEPAVGLWTPPAGFLEMNESMAEGAARETLEEALADVEIIRPFARVDLIRIGQVHEMFLARLRDPQVGAGEESLEVKWFCWSEIPWPDLAFPVIEWILRLRMADLQAQQEQYHCGSLRWKEVGSPMSLDNYDLGDLQSLRLKV
ncbi:MAG: NUDIX hydrolase [Planctomycetota bacterium]|nr:NUDIX hydrolase [Planctomycetota bacterium]